MISNITLQQFEEHFKTLVNNDTGIVNPEIDENVFAELDAPFTEIEVERYLRRLKRYKSTGLDNIMNEYLLTGNKILIPVLCSLFYNILNAGNFPELWVKCVIIPVFKKGDNDQTGNYRGISLVSHIGKLFTSLINTRLLKWSEENSITTDSQFGFRPGYGTTDTIFAIHAFISNMLS